MHKAATALNIEVVFFETERLPLRKTKGKYLWKLLLGQLADTKNYTESTVHADSPTVALQQKPACVTMPCRVLEKAFGRYPAHRWRVFTRLVTLKQLPCKFFCVRILHRKGVVR